ncbi:hypothetical protein N8878_00140 [Psychromonas sp.]|nr:hypothetical protein [Psychromonas sp.]
MFDNSRNFTKQEQEYLQKALNSLPVPRKRHLKAALNTAVFWIFSLTAFCIAWFIGSLIISAIFTVDIGISSEYAKFLFPLLILLAAFLAINSTKRWLAESPNEYALVTADLKQQKALTECYQVLAVKCFKEPEHNGLLYFLLLKSETDSAHKIRAMYDYESQNDKPDDDLLLSITNALTICIAPHSKIVVSNNFHGEAITNIIHFQLTAPPSSWPKPDSWQNFHWDQLQAIYSNKN